MENNALKKHKGFIIYLVTSLFIATFESVSGIFLVANTNMPILIANTISIVLGTIIHYILVNKSVFKASTSKKTFTVFLSTSIASILLQNALVWIIVRSLSSSISENTRYSIAKVISLIIAFFAVYFIRKLCYFIIRDKDK